MKILTQKNIEEAGDQWLTEEDTKSFRELLINLLVTGVMGIYWVLFEVVELLILYSWTVAFKPVQNLLWR